jgi:hypothetical protein
MEQLRYTAKGEYGISFRQYFQKGIRHRTHNVHVFEQGNPEIERHLKFRDWMRTHDNDRDLYGKLKTELALKFQHDIMNYCLGKDAFIADIDTKAGFDGLRIVSALIDREWEVVRYLRQKYFFDCVPIGDPYTWAFNHKEHVHFVLYIYNCINYAALL